MEVSLSTSAGQGSKHDGTLSAKSPLARARPLLRWAGGKSWLADSHPELITGKHRSYIEPFLGGASLFLTANPSRAYLSDSNEDLITFYKAVARSPEAVWRAYQRHVEKHCLEHYNSVRTLRTQDAMEEAARLLYLNRACFNGLYRVNKRGEFNVPLGSPRFEDLTEDSLMAVAAALQCADLRAGDFSDAVAMARDGDLLVLDPPYTVAHNQNGFVRYNEKIFSWEDQIRLAASAEAAVKRGATVVATNANHATVAALYTSEWFKLNTLARRSSMAARASARGSFSELLITSR